MLRNKNEYALTDTHNVQKRENGPRLSLINKSVLEWMYTPTLSYENNKLFVNSEKQIANATITKNLEYSVISSIEFALYLAADALEFIT